MANPGGSSCRLRHHCARILMRHRFAVWQGRPKTGLRLAGFWHSRLSTMGQRAPRRPRSAVSDFRSSGTGCKAGMIGMARTWALELAPDGITVNVVAPGPSSDTEMFRSVVAKDSEREKALAAAIP